MKKIKDIKNKVIYAISDKRGECDYEPTDRMIELDVERIREIIPDVPEEEWDAVIVKACEYYHEYLQRKKARDR